MKKLILLIGLALTANAGGIWDMIKNTQSDGTIKTKQYTIDAYDVDIRGYVYDVPEMKSICWQVFSRGTHRLECKTYKEIGITKN